MIIDDAKLYISTNGSDWVNLSSANLETTDYRYFKVAYETSVSGQYSNFNNINIGQRNSETAVNLANYVMFEDTNNQCTTKLTNALNYFNNLSVSERALFMTSDDYVIATARERLLAWAANQGRAITYSGGDYVIASKQTNIISIHSETYIIVVAIALMSMTAIGGCFLYKRKNREQ